MLGEIRKSEMGNTGHHQEMLCTCIRLSKNKFSFYLKVKTVFGRNPVAEPKLQMNFGISSFVCCFHGKYRQHCLCC